MIFGLPNQTPYDLKWRMFGTDIRVTPFFWIITLIFGFRRIMDGFEFLAIWVAVVFVSILVHEFGHILVGRRFGSPGHIVLHGLGGLAIGSNNLSNRWQRIAVSLGGPAAQFGLLIPCLVAAYLLQPSDTIPGPTMSLTAALGAKTAEYTKPSLVAETLDMLIFVNLLWPLLNLMPVWPLDGGHVCRELLQMRMPGTRGQRAALIVSIITAGLLAVFMLIGDRLLMVPIVSLYGATGSEFILQVGLLLLSVVHPWNAIFFGLLGVMSYLQLKGMSGGGGPGWGMPERREPWQMDPDYWKTGRKPWGN